MTLTDVSLICLGFLIQVCVFFVGAAVGASVKRRITEEEEKREARRRYEAALRFWHTPQSVEKN